MENAALCPARVHQVGRGVRLHYEVAVDDLRTTAGADHRVVPPLGEMITEAELAEEAGTAAHRPDPVGTAVDMEGDPSLHRCVGDRRPGLLLHPVPETPGWTLPRGIKALQVRKELILVCARRVLLLKDPHRLPDLTRAVEVWQWMSLIDKPCILSLGVYEQGPFALSILYMRTITNC